MKSKRNWLTLVAGAAVVAAISTGAGGCEGRPQQATSKVGPAGTQGGPAIVELDLSDGDPEQPSVGLFGPSRAPTHLDRVQTLRRLRDEKDLAGVLVQLGLSDELGLARALELGEMLGVLRDKGVPVVCHADEYGKAALLLASLGCSKLWVSPAGGVDAVGLAIELVFVRELLDKLKVDVDMLQVGKYKGANEPFTRDSASPEARESLTKTLRGLRTAWIAGITKGRDKETIAESLETGPFAPDEAKTRGLVDAVGYLHDARDDAKKLAGTDAIAASLGEGRQGGSVSRGVLDVLRALAGDEASGLPHVAVIRAIGAISMGGSPSLLGSSDGISEAELGPVIARVTEDASAKAVVLRIDSPGGSALASDLLWDRLMRLRAKKPLIVSVGGMAASGGYYMACTGTKILAEPTSILGSIGVVGGKFAVGRTLETLGVHVETVTASPNAETEARAAYMSPFSAWDDPTKERMLASMTAIYDLFLSRVAEGRGIEVGQVSESAEGQVFGGVEAKERGLVDTLGGLDDALQLARQLGDLPEDAPVEAVGGGAGLFGFLDAEDEGQGDDAKASDKVAARVEQRAIDTLIPEWNLLPPELRALIASTTPLMTGERALAAVPYAIVVR